jgi:hypothetical protein
MVENEVTIYETLSWNQVNPENLSLYKAIGVNGISVRSLPVTTDSSSAAEDLRRMSSLVQSYGMSAGLFPTGALLRAVLMIAMNR